MDTGFGIQEYNGWLGHFGEIAGYTTACFYNAGIDARVVVMVNRRDGGDDANQLNRSLVILNDVVGTFFPGFPTGLANGVAIQRKPAAFASAK